MKWLVGLDQQRLLGLKIVEGGRGQEVGILVVKCCQEMFTIDLPSDIIKKRSAKFDAACDDIVS